MSIKKLMIFQFLLYTFVFMGYSMTYTQIIPFLIELGYDPVQRGFILSFSSIIAIFGQFFVGYLCDKYNTVKKFYHLLLLLYVIFNSLTYTTTGNYFFLHLIVIGFMGGTFRIIAGIVETWTIETNEYTRKNFGSIRAFGSIGWAIGSPFVAYLIVNFGYVSISWAFALLSIISYYFSINLPDATKLVRNEMLRVKDLKQLLQNKSYVLLLAIFILVNIVFSADMFTVIDKILFLNGTNNDVALKWSVQAISELPFFFMGVYFLEKYGGKKLLIFSIVMYILRFYLNSIAFTPMQLVWVSGLQALTFPFIMISQKVLISDESPENLKSSGQLFAIALYAGLSGLITPVLSGALVSIFGYDITLLILTGTLFIPLVLSFFYKEKGLQSHII